MPNQRSKDKKKISVWMTTEEQKALEAAAKEQGFKNLPDFLRAVANGTVKTSIKILVACAMLAKLTHSPTDWSGEALAQAVGTGCVWFGQGVAWLIGGAWQVGGALLASM